MNALQGYTASHICTACTLISSVENPIPAHKPQAAFDKKPETVRLLPMKPRSSNAFGSSYFIDVTNFPVTSEVRLLASRICRGHYDRKNQDANCAYFKRGIEAKSQRVIRYGRRRTQRCQWSMLTRVFQNNRLYPQAKFVGHSLARSSWRKNTSPGSHRSHTACGCAIKPRSTSN